MSNTRKEQMDRFAEMFKALSNPHRLHIFLRLISCCPPGTRCPWDSEASRYVGQLAEEVSIAPSTVSHHIKELRNATLIKVARQGKNIECWVDPDVVRSLAQLLSGHIPHGLLQDGPPQGAGTADENRKLSTGSVVQSCTCSDACTGIPLEEPGPVKSSV
jgi:ArsR family transcriptional regulator, arsenate/arsenite/antimonite-responsive transcriptional repressor